MVAKAKRVFCKWMMGSHPITGTALSEVLGDDTWVVEEDVTIIGASLLARVTTPSENDGFARFRWELSQSGQMDKDGTILDAGAVDWWNTAPPGIAVGSTHAVVMFPEGYGVPISEGGTLYLHGHGVGKSAGTVTFSGVACVYYTKG